MKSEEKLMIAKCEFARLLALFLANQISFDHLNETQIKMVNNLNFTPADKKRYIIHRQSLIDHVAEKQAEENSHLSLAQISSLKPYSQESETIKAYQEI